MSHSLARRARLLTTVGSTAALLALIVPMVLAGAPAPSRSRGAVAVTQPGGSSVLLSEGWESGQRTQSFNSRDYGNLAGSQFGLQERFTGAGRFALEHRLTAGMSPGAIQFATQHFGDALAGPVLPVGQGRHFDDLYVQYKVAYSPGFEMGTGYKQMIIGTQDDRRHADPCCNPWVAHYVTVFPAHPSMRGLLVEVNNKQAEHTQWTALGQNAGGFSAANPFVMQTGRFYTVEVRRRLNTLGRDDGIVQMWVDGRLVADHRQVRLRIPRTGQLGSGEPWGTNFIMISDYSATPPTRDQSIYYDDVRVSTAYIGQ